MQTDPTDVLIAGAGPTGLLLALWLTRLGVKVRICDGKTGPTTETRAIAVQARTMEFYDQLGLGREALARGRNFGALRLWLRGALAGSVQLGGVATGDTPHPYLYILTQDQNEAMLLAHLEALGGRVEWQTEVTSLAQTDDGVTATLSCGPERRKVRATWLAGCDGARSAVRHGLGIQLSGGTYERRFYVADVTAHGKLYADDVNVCMDDGEFIAFFPMREAHRHRIVGQLPPGAGADAGFSAVRAQVEARDLSRIDQLHWFSTYQVHHRVADRFRRGRVFLLGDVGHVHSPLGGQGMNTGLGDAANLAWKLAQVAGGGDAALLDSYETERRPFAVSLVRTTDQAFNAIIGSSLRARLVRTVVIPWLLPVLTFPRAVRRLLFLRVSQILIRYRDSPLSQGRAGRVRGGDRLPWVPAGKDGNFGALRSLRWQCHVYGEAPSGLAGWCAARGIALEEFAPSAEAARAGLARDAVYLVRPDGYVGLALPAFDAAVMDAYAARCLPAA
ncbi:MAG: Pentachlorophenol monooxygenase [Polaromonas sp.]|nr:Pentachlorophenol monooxygenase [Polaromonas sp.]